MQPALQPDATKHFQQPKSSTPILDSSQANQLSGNNQNLLQSSPPDTNDAETKVVALEHENHIIKNS